MVVVVFVICDVKVFVKNIYIFGRDFGIMDCKCSSSYICDIIINDLKMGLLCV